MIVGFIILIVLVATGSLLKRAGRKGCAVKSAQTVSCEQNVPDEQIKERIERVGYTLKEIR